MKNKLMNLNIRTRLTLLSTILLTLCSLGLTLVLNYYAFQSMDMIESAQITIPATTVEDREVLTIQPMIPLETSEAKKGFASQSFMFMVLFISSGSLLTYIFVSKALKPLETLEKTMDVMDLNRLSTNLDVPKTKDEIASLTESFNQMSNQLHEAFEKQKRFSANAAHELKTPLATMQTQVDVFKKTQHEDITDYENLIQVFDNQIKRLRELVTNLLETTNKQDLVYSEVNLELLLQEVVQELSPLANEKEIMINMDLKPIYLKGNVDSLYRAFYNILDNAIKYNKLQGEVSVDMRLVDDQIKVRIMDTGIGIPTREKEFIFEPFYRIDKSRTSSGNGLGLSLVKEIVEYHDGEIHVTDISGQTCFEISFKK